MHGKVFNKINYVTLHLNLLDRSTNIFNEMKQHKELFIEPRDSDKFYDTINNYKREIDAKKSYGAVFFSVCRGKVITMTIIYIIKY